MSDARERDEFELLTPWYVAGKLDAAVADVKKMTIWGNHSTTQYPDLFHCEVGGRNAAQAVGDQAWIENDFIPTVAAIRGGPFAFRRGLGEATTRPVASITCST
mgnify:CR=1 FL=1